ncbi:hypothetical protein QBC44DRAFT_253964, partial [Cladorrhinum sp. PSN332]
SISRLVFTAQAVYLYEKVGSAILFEIGRKSIYIKPITPFIGRLKPYITERYINI